MTTCIHTGYAQVDPTIKIFYTAGRVQWTNEWVTDKATAWQAVCEPQYLPHTHTDAHTPHVCVGSIERGGGEKRGRCGLCLSVYLRVMKTLQLLHWKLILKTETELARCRLLLVREGERQRGQSLPECMCVCVRGGEKGGGLLLARCTT